MEFNLNILIYCTGLGLEPTTAPSDGTRTKLSPSKVSTLFPRTWVMYTHHGPSRAGRLFLVLLENPTAFSPITQVPTPPLAALLLLSVLSS